MGFMLAIVILLLGLVVIGLMWAWLFGAPKSSAFRSYRSVRPNRDDAWARAVAHSRRGPR